jgi:hypothetical protein
MSAKSKQLFAASPTETLTTVTRLAGIQRANGNLMLLGMTCPTREFNGSKQFKLKIRGLRSPFLMIRYRIVLGTNPTNYANTHYFEFYEQISPADNGLAVLHRRNWASKRGGVAHDQEYVHVHRVSYGIGGTTGNGGGGRPALVVYDPTTISMKFNIDTTNGTENGNHIRNLVIAGFSGYDKTQTGENVPLRTKQADTYQDIFSYSEWPG